MKVTKIILLFFVVFLIFISCKKVEKPQDSETSPVFTFNGEIDGIPVSLVAGQNNYYMYSSFSQDVNGLKTYSANLTTINCSSNCNNSLKISFIDYDFSNPISTLIDSTFYLGNYNFATNSGFPSRYNVSFLKNTGGQLASAINWNFGDGTNSSDFNPSHKFVRPGKYNVCMNANMNGGCTHTTCHELQFGNLGDFCESNISVGTISNTTINFSGTSNGGTAPYTFFWNFGDGNTSTSQNVSHTYSSEGVYNVTLTVTDSKGVFRKSNINVRTQNSITCISNFASNFQGIANPSNLGNVVVEWVDSNGNLYTSKSNSQSSRSNFKINSIEEYDLNENWQKTKKLNINFSCLLFNGANQIEVKNASAIIAVAY